jgi:(d)CTP diphosphatase
MRVVSCFLEYDNKFVLLHRLPHKVDGDTWGLPNGKVEADESDIEAIQRELFEETGYQASIDEIENISTNDFMSPRGDTVTYITHRIKLNKPHAVIVEESAHSEYRWVTAEDADAMNSLIHSLHDLFRIVKLLD